MSPGFVGLVGEAQALATPVALGEFVIPRRGLFVVARAYLEKVETTRHARTRGAASSRSSV